MCVTWAVPGYSAGGEAFQRKWGLTDASRTRWRGAGREGGPDRGYSMHKGKEVESKFWEH